MPFEIQPVHILLIVVVAVLLFGPRKLPQLGHNLGKAITEFRNGTKDVSENIRQGMNQPDSQAAGPSLQDQPVSTSPAGGFCIHCGAPIQVEASFCNNCGIKLNVGVS